MCIWIISVRRRDNVEFRLFGSFTAVNGRNETVWKKEIMAFYRGRRRTATFRTLQKMRMLTHSHIMRKSG